MKFNLRKLIAMTGNFKKASSAHRTFITLNMVENLNLIVMALFLTGALFGVEKNAEDFYGDGLLKSVEEDWSGAVEAFEKSYELAKQEDVKESLIEVLMKKGKKELLANRYSNALQCFDRILVLDPADIKAKKLQKILASKTNKKVAKKSVKEKPPEKPPSKKPEVSRSKSRTTALQQGLSVVRGKSPVKPIPVKKNKILTGKRKKKREVSKRVVKEKPPEKLSSKKPEVSRSKSLVKPIPVKKKLRIDLWFRAAAGITLIFFIAFISYLLKKKRPQPEIQVLPQSRKKFASKISLDSFLPAKQKLPSILGKKYIPDGITRAMLENPNAHVRARGVELVAEELRGSPTEIIERILIPCLSDSDSRVRANAAKALYEYNPEAAMNTLRTMSKHSDKWMRLSASWVFEKIGTPEAIENLLLLIDDEDIGVRSRTSMYLKKYYMQGKAPENLMQKLKEVLG